MFIKILKTLVLNSEKELAIMISEVKENEAKPYKPEPLTASALKLGALPAKIVNAIAENNEFCPV